MTTALDRRALATELLAAVAANKPAADHIEGLKDRLKTIATRSGAGFREVVDGKGEVKVRAETPGGFKGLVPVLEPELFLASDEAEQERLKTAGLVSMKAQYGRGSSAAVTATLA